jgi:hypothetical protein
MKTIEEKACEYAENAYIVFPQSAVKSAFIAGYRAAQEWISVEDELPENMRTVIVRDNGISPIRSLALFKYNIFYPDFEMLKHENITHWRPINND